MNEFEQDSSFLRFGTWSVLLHVLFFVFVSFVHFSLQVEKPPPTVKVTFVEVPAPPPPPEPAPQAPAMRQAQRLQPQPVQRKQIQPTPQPPDISQPVEMPKVVQAPPPQQPPPQPMKRRLLQDNRATDTLQARNLTKTASRKTTTKNDNQGCRAAIDVRPRVFDRRRLARSRKPAAHRTRVYAVDASRPWKENPGRPRPVPKLKARPVSGYYAPFIRYIHGSPKSPGGKGRYSFV